MVVYGLEHRWIVLFSGKMIEVTRLLRRLSTCCVKKHRWRKLLQQKRQKTRYGEEKQSVVHLILTSILFLPHCALSVSATVSDTKELSTKMVSDLGLKPIAFSASSVLKNKPEFQADKANFHVFEPQTESSGAWCPAQPVQNRLTEWLQVEFDALKILRILFTDERRDDQTSKNRFVKTFLLRYQRQDSSYWSDYRSRNGSKLLHANHNSATNAIPLDPPIVAKRFRIYPYNELEPLLMCLRVAVYGSAFDDGVIEYAIPEGDEYRLDYRQHFTLNDTCFDGHWILGDASIKGDYRNSVSQTERRAYLHSGLGLLMDKEYYHGQLPEPDGINHVVGWFRRQHPSPSGRITMLFSFDQVRNFTLLRLHGFNTLKYIALFRRVLVQFSVGGTYFDRLGAPILLDVERDTRNNRPRWISVPLQHRIGQYLRVTLWFDYDWIVLSEITFASEPLLHTNYIAIEKTLDPIQHLPELKEFERDPENRILFTPFSTSDKTSTDFPVGERLPSKINDDIIRDAATIINKDGTANTVIEEHTVNFDDNVESSTTLAPYILVITACIMGIFALASIFVSYHCCRRYRQRHSKKLMHSFDKNCKPSTVPQIQQQQHPLLPSNANQFCALSLASPMQGAISDNGCSTLLGNNNTNFQYTSSVTGTPIFHHPSFNASDTTQFTPLGSFNPGTLNLSAREHFALGTIPMHQYGSEQQTIDQDSLLALQILHQGSLPTSNFSTLGGLTLAHRGRSDSSAFASYPFTSVPTNNLVCGVPYSTTAASTVPVNGSANTQIKLSFCPPPPPDQPLPPLPPPSVSPDGSYLSPQLTSVMQYTSNQLTDSALGDSLTNRTVSSVAPYAASFPAYSLAVDNGLVLQSSDFSIPEYASASLFSGTSSTNRSPGPPPKPGIPGQYKGEQNKVTSSGETYCSPHPNAFGQHLGLWRPSVQTAAVIGYNDVLTNNMDNIGMFYLNSNNDAKHFTLSNGTLHANPAFMPISPSSQLMSIRNSVVISNPEEAMETNNFVPASTKMTLAESMNRSPRSKRSPASNINSSMIGGRHSPSCITNSAKLSNNGSRAYPLSTGIPNASFGTDDLTDSSPP